MSSKKRIRPVSFMKKNAASLLADVQDGAVVITQNGEPKAVVQSVDDFERQKDALLMLRLIAHGESEIRAGSYVEQDAVFDVLATALQQKPGREK